MKNFLTADERDRLRAEHKKERDKRICDRIKAILLYDKGWTLIQIADALLLSDDAVRKHLKDYQESQKLIPESGGSIEKLSLENSKLLEAHLQSHTYLYIKDIIAYVNVFFGVSYSVSGFRYWLKRHGFSYKKPSLVPGKANIEEQRRWIAKYEQLKQGLLEDETICFIDGVHPTHNTQLAYGWIKKGFRKEIAANSGRSRLNLTGALDLLSSKILVQEDKTLNADSTIAFLKKLEESYPTKSKIHLFCDNARYYRNKSVTAFIETSRIVMHFLPPYSPNLNPIERVWKWMKERVLYNTYYEFFDEFKSAVFGFFKGLASIDPNSILGQSFASRIKDNFRPIGAPVSDF